MFLGFLATCARQDGGNLTFVNLKSYRVFRETISKISSTLVPSVNLISNYSNSSCDKLYKAYPLDASLLDSRLVQTSGINFDQTDQTLIDFVLHDILTPQPFLYSKVLIVSPLVDDFYSNSSFYRKCGLYYSCNFQVDFMLLNSSCIADTSCVDSALGSYFSRIEAKFMNASANITYFNDFTCIDESGWLVLIYGATNPAFGNYVFKGFEESILSFFTPYKQFDVVLIGNQVN